MLTPALLFYPDRIQTNIDQMVKIAGDPNRLRPHVKTYKCKEIVAMQMASGIRKFKCATLAEAIMLAEVGVRDVLLAYPLIGPAQKKFVEIMKAFPQTTFSVLVDDAIQIKQWKAQSSMPISVFIDLDVGMERTGIKPREALALKLLLDESFVFKGFHVYDGHIHHSDPNERAKAIERSLKPVWKLLGKIDRNHWGEIVCGGSISFPHHAKYPDRHLSPGTSLLWDQGYGHDFPDLPFEVAAMVACRVISKPGKAKICLDIGYKAIASEMKTTPIYFPELERFSITNWSEEHMVLEIEDSESWQVGDVLYGVPWHICPTVALHDTACVIEEGRVKNSWKIVSRARVNG